jgi:hypothetical protein
VPCNQGLFDATSRLDLHGSVAVFSTTQMVDKDKFACKLYHMMINSEGSGNSIADFEPIKWHSAIAFLFAVKQNMRSPCTKGTQHIRIFTPLPWSLSSLM